MKTFEHLRVVVLLHDNDEICAISAACQENHDSLNLLTFTQLSKARQALQALQEARLTPEILISEQCYRRELEEYLADEAGLNQLQFYLFCDGEVVEHAQTDDTQHSEDAQQQEETPLNNIRTHVLLRPQGADNYAACIRSLKSQWLHH